MAEGNSFSSFPRLSLIQGYQVQFITLLKTVMPHSIASLSLPVLDSLTGFDHTRKVYYSSNSEEMLEVNGHPSKERLGNT